MKIPTYAEAIAKLRACPHWNQYYSTASAGGPLGMEPFSAWRFCLDCNTVLSQWPAPPNIPGIKRSNVQRTVQNAED